jgi:hypothetical protein
MKAKNPKKKAKTPKNKDLWANPSYRNMLNPYESKYPQGKKPSSAKK